MKALWRHRPSPATVLAGLALVVALGGTGYAAITLPANSVGTAQLKKDAVTSLKVKNGSLLSADFKAGQVPAGATGPAGAAGAAGPPVLPGCRPRRSRRALPRRAPVREDDPRRVQHRRNRRRRGRACQHLDLVHLRAGSRADREDRPPGGGGTGRMPGKRDVSSGAGRGPLHLRGVEDEHGGRDAERRQPFRGDDLRELDRGRRLLQLRHLGGHRKLILHPAFG